MDVLWISIGAAVAIVGSAWATAWAQSRIGAAAAAMLAEKPELRTTAVLLIAIPESAKQWQHEGVVARNGHSESLPP